MTWHGNEQCPWFSDELASLTLNMHPEGHSPDNKTSGFTLTDWYLKKEALLLMFGFKPTSKATPLF